MYHNELFGLRLRKVRNQAKETQKQLADLLCVSSNQIGEMENGRGATTLAKLALLCEHYNITADYLLGLIDEPRPLRNAGPDTGDLCHSSERT